MAISFVVLLQFVTLPSFSSSTITLTMPFCPFSSKRNATPPRQSLDSKCVQLTVPPWSFMRCLIVAARSDISATYCKTIKRFLKSILTCGGERGDLRTRQNQSVVPQTERKDVKWCVVDFCNEITCHLYAWSNEGTHSHRKIVAMSTMKMCRNLTTVPYIEFTTIYLSKKHFQCQLGCLRFCVINETQNLKEINLNDEIVKRANKFLRHQ